MKLNFPKANIQLKISDNKRFIYDIIRKKWMVFTPEEFVRQHLVHFLVQHKNIPLSLISVEKQINVNRLKKRFDVLVFKKTGQPLILAECKAPDIILNENALLQIANYNIIFNAPYLIITNGITHYYFKLNQHKYILIGEIDEFEQI